MSAPQAYPREVAMAARTVLTGRVLIVDDSKLDRRVLTDLIRQEGHHVTAADDAQEALGLLQRHTYDLILLDLVLPDLDGVQLLERIYGSEEHRAIPVLFITALDSMRYASRAIQLGAEDYILKPFEPEQLRSRVTACIEKKREQEKEQQRRELLDLENQRKSEEIEQARQIQESMLPARPPELDYLDIAARQLTATEVGGDYYDFLPRGEGLLCAIGDAAGHGVGAGSMVGITKALLLSHCNSIDSLPDLIGRMNDIVCQTGLTQETNMALMLLDFQRRAGGLEVRATGGSMPPIYVLRKDGRLDQSQISGVPLGLIRTADTSFDELTLRLEPGDTLILMSDGLPEIVNAADQMLDYDRMEERLSWLDPALPAGRMLQQNLRIGDDWAEDEALKDDLTIVVLKARA